MVYVGMSRVRSFDGLCVKSFSRSTVRAHPDALQFYAKSAAASQPYPVNVDRPSVRAAPMTQHRPVRSLQFGASVSQDVVESLNAKSDSKTQSALTLPSSANGLHPAISRTLRSRGVLQPIQVNDLHPIQFNSDVSKTNGKGWILIYQTCC
jgi:hypothetical protein